MTKNYLDPFDPRYPDADARLKAIVQDIGQSAEPVPITRLNVDQLLDAHQIEVHMKNGNWWEIRRNGRTQLWKTHKDRIRVPFKYGMRGYGAITTWDFKENGALDPMEFRVKPPPELRK